MSGSDPKEDILLAFAVEDRHDSATLERYLAQHPELADDLIDLSNELRLARAFGPTDVPPEESADVDAAFNELLNAAPALAQVPDLFSPYTGQAFAELARALNLPRSFLQPFRDRLVDPLSIPSRFVQRFANATRNNTSIAKQYFALPPVAEAALSFKSEGKPGAPKQVRFADLVAATPSLTDEQRAILAEDIKSHGSQ
ncbi:hypothetical protein [Hydrocarboniphaga effusa]|jgi:hypothetical protein|uniref:hypothetical protein n=1 Tax=Hydrocarboniphaga effusa TaxID=243629 RepID=UPI003137E9A6